jgi:hypothetical protein
LTDFCPFCAYLRAKKSKLCPFLCVFEAGSTATAQGPAGASNIVAKNVMANFPLQHDDSLILQIERRFYICQVLNIWKRCRNLRAALAVINTTSIPMHSRTILSTTLGEMCKALTPHAATSRPLIGMLLMALGQLLQTNWRNNLETSPLEIRIPGGREVEGNK